MLISGIFSSFVDWVKFWDETLTASFCIDSGAGAIFFSSVHPLNRTDSNSNIIMVVTILFLNIISFLFDYHLFRLQYNILLKVYLLFLYDFISKTITFTPLRFPLYTLRAISVWGDKYGFILVRSCTESFWIYMERKEKPVQQDTRNC